MSAHLITCCHLGESFRPKNISAAVVDGKGLLRYTLIQQIFFVDVSSFGSNLRVPNNDIQMYIVYLAFFPSYEFLESLTIMSLQLKDTSPIAVHAGNLLPTFHMLSVLSNIGLQQL